MTSSLGITPARMASLNANFEGKYKAIAARTAATGVDGSTSTLQRTQATDTISTQPAVSQTTGNTSTDGKDDGKIGFFGAVGSMIKGAAKGAVKMVTGCFLDKNGNFSPLKTLATVAIGAACIAFPAVGLVAGAVGCVIGGAKVLSGVATAVSNYGTGTDAQAKDAWEQVGEGVLDVALSAKAVKASYGKVVKTAGETAGAMGKIAEAQKAGTWADASKLTKAKYLASDMWTSSKNNFEVLKPQAIEAAKTARSALSNFPETVKNKAWDLKYEAMSQRAAKFVGNDNHKTSQTNFLAKLAQMENDKGIEVLGRANEIAASAAEAAESAEKLSIIGKIQNIFKVSQTRFTTLTNGLSDAGKAVSAFFAKGGTYEEAVAKYGYESVAETLQVFAGVRTLDNAG